MNNGQDRREYTEGKIKERKKKKKERAEKKREMNSV